MGPAGGGGPARRLVAEGAGETRHPERGEPRRPAGSPDPGGHQRHLRIVEPLEQRHQGGLVDLDVGVDERDERGGDLGQPCVPCTAGTDVGVEAEEPGAGWRDERRRRCVVDQHRRRAPHRVDRGAATVRTARPPARHYHRQHRGALGLGVGRVVERRVECRVARQRVHDTQVDETREQAVDARATGRHGAVALEALEERHGGVGHREQT